MSAPHLFDSREPQSGGPASSDADSLVQLVNQLSDPARANAAMTDLWVRVEGYLKWRVAGLIAERNTALVGPESVANEAYHGFLKLHSSGKVHIADRGGLLALLSKIAIRKLIDRGRRLEAKKRRPHGSTLVDDSDSGIPSDADMAALLDELDVATDFERADDGQLGGGKRVAVPERLKDEYRVSHPVDQAAADSQSGLPPLDRLMADFDPFLREVIREKIDSLPGDLPDVFVHVYVHKRTDAEVEEIMDISENLIRQKINSIREIFADLQDDSIIGRTNRQNRKRRSP